MRLIGVLLAALLGAPPQQPEPDALGDVVVEPTAAQTDGPRLIRLTLVDASGPAPEVELVDAVLRRDLDLSGQFALVDARAEARVAITVTRAGGGASQLDAALSFGADADVPAYRIAVTGSTLQLRALTHRLADGIIAQLTGTAGPFVSRLTMVVRRGDTRSVHTIDADGHGLRRITGAEKVVGDAALGPDDLLYYSASENPGRSRIYREDGDGPLPLTLPGSVYGLSFSPDRARVALTAGVGADVRLFAGPADFSALTEVGDLALTLGPSFGPDGSLAVAGTNAQRPRIHVEGRPVSPARTSASSPSFCDHADGVRLVYARGEGDSTAIVVTDPRGRSEHTIVSGPGSHSAPACSPDGRLVAFFSTRRRGEGPGLYVVRIDGHHLRKLADVTGESLRWSRVSPLGSASK